MNDAQGGEYMNQKDGTTLPTLVGAAQNWGSPRATDGKAGSSYTENTTGKSLTADVGQWQASARPTPKTTDFQNPGAHGTGGPDLKTSVDKWPTPMGSDDGMKVTSTAHQKSLIQEASIWQTPNVPNGGRSTKHAQKKGRTLVRNGKKVQNQLDSQSLTFHQDQQTQKHGEKSSKSTRRLNPQFVEWLMGWPIGMTDCASPVTELSHYRERMQSALCSLFYTTK